MADEKRGIFVLAFKEHSLKHVLGDRLFDDVYERSQVGFQPWKVVEIKKKKKKKFSRFNQIHKHGWF